MTTGDITIERATATDADALAKIGRETFIDKFGHLYAADDLDAFLETSHTPGYYRALLDNPQSRVWKAALPGGKLAGYAVAGRLGLPVADPLPDALELERLYIDKDHRAQGLGGRFMDAFFDWARDNGDPVTYVGVFSENFGAQNFYRRYGFEKVGEYEFPVGRHRDLEFIFRRSGV